MTNITKLELERPYFFEPALMAEAEAPFPIIGNYLVPLQVSKNVAKFRDVTPTIVVLGDGAIRLSLEEPFAFARLVEETGQSSRTDLSQKTSSLTVTPSSAIIKKGWSVVVETEYPLTRQDEFLFDMGVETYARYASHRLADKGLLS